MCHVLFSTSCLCLFGCAFFLSTCVPRVQCSVSPPVLCSCAPPSLPHMSHISLIRPHHSSHLCFSAFLHLLFIPVFVESVVFACAYCSGINIFIHLPGCHLLHFCLYIYIYIYIYIYLHIHIYPIYTFLCSQRDNTSMFYLFCMTARDSMAYQYTGTASAVYPVIYDSQHNNNTN